VIVIVGAGPIGIYTADSLVKLGHKVSLLESGGFDNESSLLTLDSYLFKTDSAIPANVHKIGGGTNHWHARFGEFLEEDFQTFENLDIHGWPYSKSELALHYKAVSREIAGTDFSDGEFLNHHMAHLKSGLHPDLDLRLFRFAEEYSFKEKLLKLCESPNFTLITECRVDSISPNEDLNGAKYICHLSSRVDIEELEATAVIICAGTLQSTKLIMNSKKLSGVRRGEIAGKGLMEHLEGFIGTIRIPKSHYELGNRFALSHANRLSGFNAGVGIRLNSTFHSVSELPSLHLEFRPRPRTITTPQFIRSSTIPNPLRVVERVYKLIRHNVLEILDTLKGVQTYGLWAKSEEFRNFNSCVSIGTNLIGEVLVYDHRVSDLSYSKIYDVLDILLPKVGEMFGAKIATYEWVKKRRRNASFGVNWHPMGTLPMGHNPESSICDPQLQLHSNEGIYIVSPAVFNRGSNGNPTFTALALASKLVEEKFSIVRTDME
jgi:choline dehydrogenase-like flavoprotein